MTFTLITDAISPLGRREATQLATRGKDIVLLGEMCALLSELAAELRVAQRVDVRALTVDLAEPDAASAVVAWLREHGIALNGVVAIAPDRSGQHAAEHSRGLRSLEEALSSRGVPWRVARAAPKRESQRPPPPARPRRQTARGHGDPSGEEG